MGEPAEMGTGESGSDMAAIISACPAHAWLITTLYPACHSSPQLFYHFMMQVGLFLIINFLLGYIHCMGGIRSDN
jgi:hypothetical protein